VADDLVPIEPDRPGGAGVLARLAVDITPLRTSKPFRRLWFGTVNLAHVAGPALGGVLISSIGLASAYGLDIATFGASLVAIFLLPHMPPVADAERPSLRSIAEGFRYVRLRPVLLAIFVADANAMVFGMPSALFPAFGQHIGGGARTVGFLYAGPWIGAFIASLLSGWIAHVRRQGLGVCFAIAVWGAAIALFGFSNSLWLAVPLLAVAGAADFISAVLRSTILLSVTPDRMRGRLSGIELTQVTSAPAIGNLEAGVVASLVNLRFSIVSGGIACVAGIALVGLAFPAFVRYDAKRPE